MKLPTTAIDELDPMLIITRQLEKSDGEIDLVGNCEVRAYEVVFIVDWRWIKRTQFRDTHRLFIAHCRAGDAFLLLQAQDKEALLSTSSVRSMIYRFTATYLPHHAPVTLIQIQDNAISKAEVSPEATKDDIIWWYKVDPIGQGVLVSRG
jgi:hypothetical protein